MLSAAARMTPPESRAIARAAGRIVGYLVHKLGWGWGALAVLGMLGAGWAAWTLPSWWGLIRDWLEQ